MGKVYSNTKSIKTKIAFLQLFSTGKPMSNRGQAKIPYDIQQKLPKGAAFATRYFNQSVKISLI